MASSSLDLWEQFTQRLQRAGYALDDIADCSDQVFLSVVSELGGFTALQTAKLQTEMKRRLRGSVSRQNSRPSTPVEVFANPSLVPLSRGTSEFDGIVQKVSTFLFNSGVTTPIYGIFKWTDTNANAAHVKHLCELHDPSTSPIQRFKWMTDDDFTRGRGGSNFFESESVVDKLCPSGIVLYSERASVKPSVGEPPSRHDVLLIADVVLGKTKLMDEADARLLQGFTMKECFASLHEDGFDSIQVLRTNGTSDAVVMLHPNQANVRYVVTFQPDIVEDFHSPLTLHGGEHLSAQNHGLPHGPGSRGPSVRTDDMSHNNAGGVVSFARCPTHPSKLLEFWCPDEKKLICSHCLFHSGYNKKTCSLIEDAAATEIHDLQTWSRNASVFLRDIQSVEKLFDAAIAEVEEESHQQIQEARVAFQNLRKAIDAAEDMIVEEVTSKSRGEVQKLQRVSAAVAKRVGEVDELHARSCRLLSKDRLEGTTALELLSIVQRAFSRWDVVPVPAYEMAAVQLKVFPSPSQIASAVTTSTVRREGTVALPEAIDINYLQMLK